MSRFMFYSDADLDTESIMSHVVTSETSMPIQELMKYVLDEKELKVGVHWRGLCVTEDNLEPLLQIHDDVPDLLQRFLNRINTPCDLVQKCKLSLRLQTGEWNTNKSCYRFLIVQCSNVGYIIGVLPTLGNADLINLKMH